MANTKISALPASTTPLAGTEVLPIVQSTTTKQVSVANLTAGRAVATGPLTVTGAATVSTTLGVTGAATLSSTLGVTGATTLSSLVTTTGTIATTPSGSTDIANKAYVDTVAQGLDTKASVVAGTTANITLSGTQTIDGVVLIAGDRVLVKNQTTTANNGLYLCAAGSWTRTTDMDTWAEVPGAYVFVEQGTTLADTGWVCTSDAGGTIGVTAIVWAQFSGAGSGVSSINFGSTGLTPSSVTTGAVTVAGTLAVANGGTGINSFGTGIATFLGTPSSANLAAALTDETGTGSAVFATSPTLVTPNLGTPTSGTATNLTGLPLTTGVTGLLPVANGGTATATPSIVAGTNVTVTGTWPNQTIASSGSSGTVTSVAATVPSLFSISGSPITTSGTLAMTYSGTALPVANGGTGETSYTNGQLLIGNTTGNTLTKATLTAGSGVTITNGSGAITIASSGGSGDVVGPASSTDNAIARFDLATGKLLQNSVVTVADTTGNVAGVGTLSLATTLGVGGATPSASGAGITFPATQSASSDANTLDDYEEGTWTPTAGGSLTVVGTFSSAGKYTKIGRVVTVTGTISATVSLTLTANQQVIFGLPFNNTSNSAGGGITSGTNTALLFNDAGATTQVYASASNGPSSSFFFSLTYFAST